MLLAHEAHLQDQGHVRVVHPSRAHVSGEQDDIISMPDQAGDGKYHLMINHKIAST